MGLLYLIIIIVAEWWRRTHTACGIPVVLWCEIAFVILLVTEFLQLPILCMLQNPGRIVCYVATYMIIALLVFFGWIIYGYSIYFADENDCQANPQTAGWLIFMIIILFIGLLVMCVLAIALCILCCLMCAMGGGDAEKDGKSQSILDKIPGLRQVYDPSRYAQDTCAICCEKFKPDEKDIIPLKCNDLHIFHQECITQNVNAGNTKCPLCNAEI